MTDKIGTLGKLATLTIGTNLVYTCPVGKAARVKLFYRVTAGVSSVFGLLVNGIKVMQTAALTTGHFVYSTPAFMSANNAAVEPDGTTDAKTAGPAPEEYYLAAGETISYTVATADLLAASVQVVGTEIDV
jgi:hypothetical protein